MSTCIHMGVPPIPPASLSQAQGLPLVNLDRLPLFVRSVNTTVANAFNQAQSFHMKTTKVVSQVITRVQHKIFIHTHQINPRNKQVKYMLTTFTTFTKYLDIFTKFTPITYINMSMRT